VVLRRLNRIENANTVRDLTGFSGNVTDDLPIDDYALATQLSYFSWSTMPDDELLQLAAKGGCGRNSTARSSG
jgi:hypothetical protein